MEQDLIIGIRFMGAASMIIYAIILALVNRGRIQSRVYNNSRYYLIAATLLLGIHTFILFFGHISEKSISTAWLVNITFYIFIIPLYYLGELNLLRAGHNIRKQNIQVIIFGILCYIVLLIGFITDTLINDDAPWCTTTFIMAVMLFLMTIRLVWLMGREMTRTEVKLKNEELGDRHNALRYTANSEKCILIGSLLAPWPGMTPWIIFHAIFALVIFCLIIWYLITFLLFGLNMPEVIEVTDEIEEAEMKKETPKQISNEGREKIDVTVQKWIESRNYTDPNITIGKAIKQMGISAQSLNYYLENICGSNYRKWIPYLRVEEAKRLMIEHPEYKFEIIADMVGMSNGSALSRAFKSQEGITPSQWLKRNETRY